jgi:hypothetical protein
MRLFQTHETSGNEPILKEATSISVVFVIFGALDVIGCPSPLNVHFPV